jgi:hypothetical protein
MRKLLYRGSQNGQISNEDLKIYKLNEIPEDLKSACIELVAWNYGRYKNKKIGVVDNKKSKDSSFEISMPENVKELLEYYRRKTI